MRVHCKYCGVKKSVPPASVIDPYDYHCSSPPCKSKYMLGSSYKRTHSDRTSYQKICYLGEMYKKMKNGGI